MIRGDMSEESERAKLVKRHTGILETLFREYRIPRLVIDVLEHYNICYARDCFHCLDCLALALIYSELEDLYLPPKTPPNAIKPDSPAWIFVKFLTSSISRRYLRCKRALGWGTIERFAWSLLEIPPEVRQKLRDSLLCHQEFKSRQFILGGDIKD